MKAITITELSLLLQKKELCARELVQEYFRRIERQEPSVGAYLTVCGQSALSKAEEIDQKRRQGEPLSALAGIPMAVKDNLCVQGIKTTCAGKMLADFTPPYTATAVKRLLERDCILLGKTNLDEFSMGSSTENSAFQSTRNPLNPERVPGGSSGGSAAAVAAREAVFALGSDTGGSIRQPAAFCGVVGMKPTYSRVSRYGLIAFASSLEQIGPITHTVRDNAAVLSAIAGADPLDATCSARPAEDFSQKIGKSVRHIKIGVLREIGTVSLTDDVTDAIDDCARKLSGLGADLVEISVPHLWESLAAYYILSAAQASSNLARFDGVRYGHRSTRVANLSESYEKSRCEGFGAEVQRRILLGTYVLREGSYQKYYQNALRAQELLRQEFDRALEQCDAILMPVTASVAFRLGEKSGDPAAMHEEDRFTVCANLTGHPAITLPSGIRRDGLPVGIQLIGRAFAETELYQIAYALEQEVTA